MLIERKTLYDPRVHSCNIPQHRAIHYAQPEKQAKELCMIQEDRHCMPNSDYYFTNIQPDPIIIPPHRGNNSSSTPQQAAAKDPIPQQTDTLRPGETRVYPSMLAEKQVPVLDLINSTITSAADLQTAFHSLNLCSTEKEDPSHGRKQSSTEEDTH